MMHSQLIVPISAAAMEQGSYRRAYPNIVKLQILNETRQIAEAVLLRGDKGILMWNRVGHQFVILCRPIP